MTTPEISVEQLATLHAVGAPIVDVRELDEYRDAHVPGVLLIPMADVPERIDEIPTDTTVYFICRTGARSRRVCEYLAAQDYDAVNVTGGIEAWLEAGYQIAVGDESG